MCVETSNQQYNNMDITSSSLQKKVSYSIKKLLKQVFRKHKQEKSIDSSTTGSIMEAESSLESLEVLENCRNKNLEIDSDFIEGNKNGTVVKAESLESSEVLENSRNKNLEFDSAFIEGSENDSAFIEDQENDLNETLTKKASCEIEDFDFSELTDNVPVLFIRTEHGTFYWTAATDIPADNDLVEPMSCSTYNQLPCVQQRVNQ